jgi:hypothetical protein
MWTGIMVHRMQSNVELFVTMIINLQVTGYRFIAKLN